MDQWKILMEDGFLQRTWLARRRMHRQQLLDFPTWLVSSLITFSICSCLNWSSFHAKLLFFIFYVNYPNWPMLISLTTLPCSFFLDDVVWYICCLIAMMYQLRWNVCSLKIKLCLSDETVLFVACYRIVQSQFYNLFQNWSQQHKLRASFTNYLWFVYNISCV